MFKEKFKFYKSRCPPPTLKDVIDFNNLSSKTNTKVFKVPCIKVIQRKPCISVENKLLLKHHHLISIEHWKIFELIDIPGLLFIVNPFTSEGQQYWVERCLKDYTRKPNKLNIDPFKDLQPGEHWWEKAHSDDSDSKKLLMKLRWATLGYHHNWDTKEYSDADRSEFPPELAELSKLIVEAIGDSAWQTYRAEAAIVNFYHLDSTLSGHRDVSEPNMESPLLSIRLSYPTLLTLNDLRSFGQSAVFLVGGETLDDPVTAMMLHSGDVVVMSGAARRCYHAVPRVCPAPRRTWGEGWGDPECGEYLETNRININIRQVLRPGQKTINR